MPLPDQLPVPPFTRPVCGEVTLPGSKSLTNRALLLAALCDQPVTLTGALFSDDTRLMVEALRQLGFGIEINQPALTLRVSHQTHGFNATSPVNLFVGLAGTTARFLTALCAAAPRGVYRLDGVPQMRKRPMKGLIDALRHLGAEIRCTAEEGFFPLEIHARGLAGGPVEVDASASSQILSALFMVMPLARTPVFARPVGGVRKPFVEMTRSLIAHFQGPSIQETSPDSGVYTCNAPGRYAMAGSYPIEPDATAASYFLALPLAVGGRLLVRHLADSRLQGDTRFIDVIRTVGMHTPPPTGQTRGIEVHWPSHSLGLGVDQNFNEFSDTFLTLAALAPLLSGPTRIHGIAHTRKQETDRVAGMANELRRLGQDVVETEDSLTITPRPLRPGVVIETYHDHRFAMSFALLGSHDLHRDGRPWLTLDNPGCCAKTFPHFFDVLDSLRPTAPTSPPTLS